MRNFGLAAVAFLLPLGASANSPITDFPCNAEMKKHEAAANAEVLKRLGKKAAGACSCFEDDCGYASVTYDIPLESTPKLTVSLDLRRDLGGTARPMSPLITTAGLGAFVRRFSAHPLGAAMLALGPAARCRISSNGSTLSASCVNGPWHLELTEDEVRTGKKVSRSLFKMNFRLPLEALKDDPELKLAQMDPLVAKFLAGKTGVVAEYGPNSPRRLVLKSGVELRGPFDVLNSKEAVTVFFKIPNNGWSDTTTGLLGACAGEQYISCK